MALQMTWQPNLHRRKSGPPLGLKNLGNTCYLNSVLQCLTYTPPLANFCLRNQHSSLCDSSSAERKRDCPFCILEKRIVRSLSVDIPLDSPLKIQSSLRIFAEHFRYGRQEDAHEFLRYVIDACHNTCLKLLKERSEKAKNRSGSNGVENYHGTVVKEIFGGALQSQVKCLSCGAESNKTDEIMDISLDLFQSCSLKDAMRRFFHPEILDGSNKYKCERCKKLSTARKQMSILRAPNVLVIQLKRFEGILGGKIDRPIAFEEVLMLSNYMCKGSQDPQPEYKLFGSIVHSGYSPESGHYYAYIKDANGRWYCCNDSHVSLSTLQEVLSEKVYILFFSRSNSRPKPSKLASNGVKAPDCNGCDVSANQKAATALKSSTTRSNGVHHTEKGPPTITKNAKVPSSPRIKFGHLKNPEARSAFANGSGSIKVPYNGLIDKCSDLKEPIGVEKVKMSLPSNCSQESREKIDMTSCSNGTAGNSAKVGDPKTKPFILPHANGESQRINADKVKEKAYKDNGPMCNVSESDHVTIDTKNDNYLSDNPGLKRKLWEIGNSSSSIVSESCNLSGQFDDAGIELEKLKKLLAKEASSHLRSCGWSDKVEAFMRTRKRFLTEAAASRSPELKKQLIDDARPAFISKIPESLKEQLVARLRSFIGGNQLLDF